jgi:hypothetical protein
MLSSIEPHNITSLKETLRNILSSQNSDDIVNSYRNCIKLRIEDNVKIYSVVEYIIEREIYRYDKNLEKIKDLESLRQDTKNYIYKFENFDGEIPEHVFELFDRKGINLQDIINDDLNDDDVEKIDKKFHDLIEDFFNPRQVQTIRTKKVERVNNDFTKRGVFQKGNFIHSNAQVFAMNAEGELDRSLQGKMDLIYKSTMDSASKLKLESSANLYKYFDLIQSIKGITIPSDLKEKLSIIWYNEDKPCIISMIKQTNKKTDTIPPLKPEQTKHVLMAYYLGIYFGMNIVDIFHLFNAFAEKEKLGLKIASSVIYNSTKKIPTDTIIKIFDKVFSMVIDDKEIGEQLRINWDRLKNPYIDSMRLQEYVKVKYANEPMKAITCNSYITCLDNKVKREELQLSKKEYVKLLYQDMTKKSKKSSNLLTKKEIEENIEYEHSVQPSL